MTTQTIASKQAQFKAETTVSVGLRMLEFYGAAFSSVPDANGDVIDPRAFDDWLVVFYAAGKPLPISFSHSAILDSLDPTNVIGYAPADPSHVWVDDYGLRVRGYLDTSSEKGKAVEWQIANGLIGGASIAYMVAEGGRVNNTRGKGMRITKVESVRETGPTPNPANQEAVLLWMKSENMLEEATALPYMTVAEFREVLMKADPEPDPQPVPAPEVPDPEPEPAPEPQPVLVQVKHAASPAYIQAAHDALTRAGAKCADEPGTEVSSAPRDEVAERLRRLRFMKVSTIR